MNKDLKSYRQVQVTQSELFQEGKLWLDQKFWYVRSYQGRMKKSPQTFFNLSWQKKLLHHKKFTFSLFFIKEQIQDLCPKKKEMKQFWSTCRKDSISLITKFHHKCHKSLNIFSCKLYIYRLTHLWRLNKFDFIVNLFKSNFAIIPLKYLITMSCKFAQSPTSDSITFYFLCDFESRSAVICE